MRDETCTIGIPRKARQISGFFFGTTEDKTARANRQRAVARRRSAAVSEAVGSLRTASNWVGVATAIFVNELLLSISRNSASCTTGMRARIAHEPAPGRQPDSRRAA